MYLQIPIRNKSHYNNVLDVLSYLAVSFVEILLLDVVEVKIGKKGVKEYIKKIPRYILTITYINKPNFCNFFNLLYEICIDSFSFNKFSEFGLKIIISPLIKDLINFLKLFLIFVK